ncbi:exocyst subunit [Coemansia sp. RSA 2336]|nr:exocyst subunit [Coemansia sp. RSA 2336]
MYKPQQNWKASAGADLPAGDADEGKELALRQAEDALWKIPRSFDGIKRKDFNPVALALQMMDTSSLGKSYDEFYTSYMQLNESLDGIVNEYYGGFNDSILTFSGLQDRIQDASSSVNSVKGGLQRVRRMIMEERGGLDQLYAKSNQLGAIVAILQRLEEVQRVREEIAGFVKDKQFLTATGKLVEDMKFVFDSELDPIEALSGLRQQLEKEKSELQQKIVDELQSHIYLKSPYCERRLGTEGEDEARGRQRIRRARKARTSEETEGNVEADSFAYVEMLIESLRTLDATNTGLQEIKSTMALELSRLIDGVVAETEERNRALLSRAHDAGQAADSEVLLDFSRILFARLETVLEYHEYVLDIANHLDRSERYSLTSPMSPATPMSPNRRAYTLADVWEAIKAEVLALMRAYLIAEDTTAGSGDVAAGGARDLFRMERGEGEAVEALYAPIAARFQDLAASAPDRRRELTAPAVLDEYSSVQSSLQHKLLASPDIAHAPELLTMALAFTRRIAPMLAAATPAVLSPAVRRSVGGDLAADGETDEYLQQFFTKTFLPHVQAQATRLFNELASASDAFETNPTVQFGGRPVFRSAAGLVPLLQNFGTLLNSLDMFRGENWGILLQLASQYYEMSLSLFRDTLRSPEGQTYLSVRWAESLDMMQLFDKRMRLGVRDSDTQREIRQEEAMKADRSLNAYELVFDVKRLATIAQLHQTLEWLLTQLENVAAERAQALRHHEGAAAAALLKRHEADRVRVVGRFQSLSVQCLMVLRIEVRLHCMHYLDLAMREGTYHLDRDADEPEPYIHALNADISSIEEKMELCLSPEKLNLVFAGISVLMAHILIANTRHIRHFNRAGNRKMLRNILALQQNLTNIALPEEGGLDNARKFYELYDLGADGILKHIAEHGPEFSFEDYRRMIGFMCSGSGQAAALSPGRANSLMEASQSDQYESLVRQLRDLLS